MLVLERKLLEEFVLRHSEVQSRIDAWLIEAEKASWKNFNKLKKMYPSASILKDNRVVFNIKGNKYRLVVKISFKNQIIRIERVGTHAEYSKWNL
jgi:mRNA interferase HigB